MKKKQSTKRRRTSANECSFMKEMLFSFGKGIERHKSEKGAISSLWLLWPKNARSLKSAGFKNKWFEKGGAGKPPFW